MLERCYSKSRLLNVPAYIGCSVCDEWLTFSNFKRWYDANYRDGYQLDKDILIQGNKVYGPDACCFVPQRINSLIVGWDRESKLGLTGVREIRPENVSGRKTVVYQAQCKTSLTTRRTKTFKTAEEARTWYVKTKQSALRDIADDYFSRGMIDLRVRDALVARTL